ncbi:MAG: hypothetical protein LKF43_09205 [Streptococcaceae bacterium]|jgi:hypothetical protein|nr:hypothetical protein [Streptococcaceae bacterium]
MTLYDKAMAKHQIKDESVSHDEMKRASGL